jgi:SAM-dependent methyltransferase
MSGSIDVPAPDPRVYTVLADAGLAPAVFNPRQHRSCVLVERYARDLGLELCARLGLFDLLVEPWTPEGIRDAHRFVPAFDPALRWLLEHARHAGVLTREGAAYRLAGPPPQPALAAVRAAGLASDPSYAPAYDLLDAAGELYPPVARGEVQADRALFLRARLWVSYFSNANGYYALTNRVAARAAAERLPPDQTVLEVGAGLGSATEALLEELHAGDRLTALRGYRMTEPVAFFRRRAHRTIEATWPRLPLASDALDLNQSWADQGVDPGSCGLVWGVNVFHLGRDLDAVLRAAHAALARGGWLIVGAGVRPSPTTPVGAELPFQLLASFHDVALDPATRPTAGFLAAEVWESALRRAGFADIETLPDVARLQSFHPGFHAAAFCARRE